MFSGGKEMVHWPEMDYRFCSKIAKKLVTTKTKIKIQNS